MSGNLTELRKHRKDLREVGKARICEAEYTEREELTREGIPELSTCILEPLLEDYTVKMCRKTA